MLGVVVEEQKMDFESFAHSPFFRVLSRALRGEASLQPAFTQRLMWETEAKSATLLFDGDRTGIER